MHITAILMVKDESKLIKLTLISCLGVIDSLVVYDTGSTDNTVEIIEAFAKEHKLPLYLKQGKFVDFSTSRNILLDYVDEINEIDYAILLDSNDKIIQNNLRDFLLKQDDKTVCCLVTQLLKHKNILCSEYKTCRLIKPRRHLKYKGVVHEYLNILNNKPISVPSEILTLENDRSYDNYKSKIRWKDDLDKLLNYHNQYPECTRTIFYLARTYEALNDFENALEYFIKRSQMQNGNKDEIFYSLYSCGINSVKLQKDWSISMDFFMRSIEHTKRVEPLIEICKYYQNKKQWLLSYTFINLACEFEKPENALFVNRHCYDYLRWHLKGIVCYYCYKYKEGEDACKKAISNGFDILTDSRNLQFYETI
jgi:glycosyltransferase involved in cell wall biosynthesis